MSVSLAGMIGAIVGAIVGAMSARFILDAVEARLRALDKSQSVEERQGFERKVTLLRRIVMTLETLTFAAVGYLLGSLFGG